MPLVSVAPSAVGFRVLPLSVGAPWILLAVGGYLAWRFFWAPQGDMTPERAAAYAWGMRSKNSARIRGLAAAFDKEGFPREAAALRARAELPNLPKDVQTARSDAVKRALASMDPDAVTKFADVVESQGMAATADALRQYARGLRAAQQVRPVTVPVSAPLSTEGVIPNPNVPPTHLDVAPLSIPTPPPPETVPLSMPTPPPPPPVAEIRGDEEAA